MKTPAFWRRGRGGWLAPLLRPLGWIYGRLTVQRMTCRGWRAPVPVIAIGNATAGGAGKTPTAIALAKALQARGAAPFILTRGYGGLLPGPVLVERASAAEVGDEALLLARAAPTVVARARAEGARLAITLGADCLILDDALQNPALEKDFTLCVVDGASGFGNGEVLPAGPLRAPLDAQKRFISAFLIVGRAHDGLRASLGERLPVYEGQLQRDASGEALAGQAVVGFCGLGLPEKFEASLRETGATVVALHRFADHHPYRDEEAQRLLEEAAQKKARLVTTAKDHVRLAGSAALDALARASTVLPVEMVLPAPLIEDIAALTTRRP